MKVHVLSVGVLTIACICLIAASAASLSTHPECEGSCTNPKNIDDCAYCCPGPATCCTCCRTHYKTGSASVYCKAYCEDIHGDDCEPDEPLP